MRLITTPVYLISLLAAVACSPYDPTLGDDPFLCGTTEPKCPDGYECVDVPGTTGNCVVNGGNPNNPDGGDDSADSGPFVCNNDMAFEPNNTINEATDSMIPDFQKVLSLDTMAICPG